LLHESGKVTFWNVSSWQLVYSFELLKEASKIVFESSFRYIAALTTSGGVEVWKLRGHDAKHWWNLDFDSVT